MMERVPLPRWCGWIARIAGGCVLVTGGTVLASWVLDFQMFKSVQPSWPKMAPAVAVGLVLGGCSLLITAEARRLPGGETSHTPGVIWPYLARFSAVTLMLIGFFKSCDYLLNLGLRFDSLGFHEAVVIGRVPEIAFMTAGSFLLLGAALLLAGTRRLRRVFEALSLLVCLIGWLGFSHYLYGGEALLPFAPMAMHTSVCFVLLSVGVLFVRADGGLMSLVLSDRAGGVLARRLLLPAMVVPFVVGWFHLRAQHAGWFSTEGELATLALSNVMIFGALVWVTAALLDRADRQRVRAATAHAGIVSSAMDAIISIDERQRITLFNPAAARMFRCAASEALNQPLDRFIPERFRRRHSEHLQRFVETGETTRAMGELATLNGLRADGEEFPIEASISRVRIGDEKIFTVMLRDIGERKQAEEALRASEQRYRALFEIAPDGILIADPESNFLDANATIGRMLGYASDELVGRHASEIVTAAELPYIGTALRALKANSDYHREWQFRRRDGSVFAGDVIAVMMPDGNLLGVIRDVTERKQAEEVLRVRTEALAAATQQLWQASKLATMGELAASVAHELNNPLATISLRAEQLIAQLGQNEAPRKSIAVILNEVERMAGLVENLLEFSRRSHRQITTIDVAEEISNSVSFISYYLRNRNVKAVPDFGGILPTIQADRQQLRQVFLNLLTNACDAMPEGGTIIARARSDQLNGAAAVLIEFTDSGVGIPPANLERIWESFFTTKPEGNGAGLGLAICRRILEEHGGTIAIKSTVDRGTTVGITLPATAGGAIS